MPVVSCGEVWVVLPLVIPAFWKPDNQLKIHIDKSERVDRPDMACR